MQQLLAASIFETFGQSVDIINGATARNETLTSTNTRKGMLTRFRESTDINFIILSPDFVNEYFLSELLPDKYA